jgi:hypothetical protein
MLDNIRNTAGFLNSNTMFAGIMLLVLNVGSRYIVHELSSDEAEYSQNILLRRLTIFAVCFVGTKDIITSIILTAGFVILAQGLFRGKGAISREGMTSQDFGKMQDPSPPLFKAKE